MKLSGLARKVSVCAFVAMTISGAAHAATDNTPAKAKPTADSGARRHEAILNKYSTEQLRNFVQNRRNKTVHDISPTDVQSISTGVIIDAIIYRQKTIYGTDRRK